MSTPASASTFAPATSFAPASTFAPATSFASANTFAPVGFQSASPPPGAGVPNDTVDHQSNAAGKGPLGPVRIGLLVGTGLPGLLSFGAMIKASRYFGAGLNVGLIPSMSLSMYGDARISYQHYELYGSLFPFGGSVFLGAGLGYATISGTTTNSVDVGSARSLAPNLPNPMTLDSEGSVTTLVLTPKAGLLHTFASGFTVGLDIGADIPVAPSAVHYKTNVPSSVPPALIQQYVTPNDEKVTKTLDKVGRTILPAVAFRIGWMI